MEPCTDGGSADDVCSDVYVCICMCNTCSDEICSMPWSHVLVVRVQLMMSVVMYMFVYVCIILVLMRLVPCHGAMYWWSVPPLRWVHNR